ncbi:MAG TPA: MmcQ/YjbR family DNA-binding protein [Gemmatimonadales bacterium]|nr:MmcQ/YjbR family DNA-binding protein [Gemmatimonadales bacterium]
MPRRTAVTLTTVRRLALALPGVEEGPCYGTPGFRVRGKFLARLWEDGETLVVRCGDDERDFRMQADPETFFITDHYRGYPAVLIRLRRVRRADLRDILDQAWRLQAPKRLLAEYENRRDPAKTAARQARRRPAGG